MLRIVIRVLGAVVAVVGIALVVLGGWFAARLGGTGTAEFTTRPAAGVPVTVSPDVLNRVDVDVTVTATPSDGGTVWVALANPSDAEAVLGDARHVDVTGVDVRDGALTTRVLGSGTSPALRAADLWRVQDDGTEPVALTVEQADAPETLVVTATTGSVESLTLTFVDKRWFVEAVVAVLVGLFLLAAGVIALWPRRRTRTPDGTPGPPHTEPEASAPARHLTGKESAR
ncbi:hypothetical protein H9L10_08600 [Phycicoccus endophyticus]|uniref:Uncharacterized protein n=1 Tax=Phycicoccus endophyticus TaxID=1690220 RepID=A0A7G9QYI2_9MICO|nr:hypothetical protein [Phycicoccus endophyticus]NHI19307.1 hypothetical protein [Phycicoccus endophyticus]QNN48407.1 hypothetical protein H9L10_08600 [Phycicoccus endophyticus]GGL41721.1 hypothetical protein GCM10012283_25420 [Phycicoccus endophyticus]